MRSPISGAPACIGRFNLAILISCLFLAQIDAASSASQSWTFTETVGGDLRTCAVCDEELGPGGRGQQQQQQPTWLRSVCSRLSHGVLPLLKSEAPPPGCRLAANPVARLSAALQQLAGQQKAAHKLQAALARHTWDRPLAFYFAGASGVGKTSTSHLLAAALFDDEDHHDDGRPPPGLVVFDGEYFDSRRPEKIEEYRDHITQELIRQLQRCPRSVIVFDELEMMDARTLAIVEPFLDSPFVSHMGHGATTGEAVFIFISNVRGDALPRDNGDDAYAVEAQLRADMVEAWGGRKKIGSLVQNVVPFAQLDEAALREIVRARLQGLPATYGHREGLLRVCFSHRVLDALASLVLRLHPRANARGVDLVLNPRVVEPLLSKLRQLRERTLVYIYELQEAEAAAAAQAQAEHEWQQQQQELDEGPPEASSQLQRMARACWSFSSRVARSSSQVTSSLLARVVPASSSPSSSPLSSLVPTFEADLYFAQSPTGGGGDVLTLELKELHTGLVSRTEFSGFLTPPATDESSTILHDDGKPTAGPQGEVILT